MSKFTKLSLVLLIALSTATFSLFAQRYSIADEQERIAAEQMAEMTHGPTTVVPPSNGNRATGDDCSDPIIVNIPAALPYSDAGQYTCGRGNNYSTTCLGSYDGGEDVVYMLNITTNIGIQITMDPLGTTWTGIALFDGCPDVGNCITYSTGSSGTTPKVLNAELYAGTYYIMVDTWPSPTCIPSFNLDIIQTGPGPVPVTPITAFPFTEDFESGMFPAEMDPENATQSHIVVSGSAGYGSSYGALFDGFNSTGWTGGSTSTTYDQAFNTNIEHLASINMTLEPGATSGQLLMEFDLKGNYGYGPNYSWFRVMADGNAIPDMDGNLYFNPDNYNSEGSFNHVVYDLSAYQGLSSFELVLQSSCKYDYLDYRDGDYWMLDNFELYFLQLGDIEGYTFNGDGIIVVGADVFIDDNTTLSGVDGYYLLTDVPYGPQDLMAWKEGYNQVTYPVNIGMTTAYQDIVLTQPNMIINPLQLHETLNPNEFLTDYLGILNNGDGPLHWNASIVYTSDQAGSGVSVPRFTGKIDHSVPDAGLAPISPQGTKHESSATRGSIVFACEAINSNLLDFDVDNVGGYTVIGPNPATDFISGFAFPPGENELAYAVVYGLPNLYTVNRTTGALTNLGSIGGPGFNDMTVDPNDGTIYATGNDQLYVIDPNVPSSTLIGGHGGSSLMIGIACDGDGNLWGYDIGNDMFYSINKTTGAATSVGSIGFDANYAQSMFYDAGTGQVTMAAFNNASFYTEIRAVDVSTGASTVLSSVYYEEMTASAMPVSGGGPSGGWLTLGQYEGDVAGNGGSFNLPVHFNATGFEAGDYVTADIIFISDPDVGTITIPCSMTIIGDPLTPPENLTAELVDIINGYVDLEWEWYGDLSFLYFRIERNGVYIGSTTATNFTDQLPEFGDYCYTVKAVYDEGASAPAGPACVSWLIPDICYYPATPEEWVWEGYTEEVSLFLENCGDGMLEYTFPAYEALHLLNDPGIEKNVPGYPFDGEQYEVGKYEKDPRSGQGNPIVLGAGGPDDFGYVWIDSDESGGPAFNWIDISATGTLVTGLSDDNNVGPFNIGFNFPFYGEEKTQYWINSNGVICFTDNYVTLTNYSIPTGNSYTDLIAWFWDDMDPVSPTQVFYENLGNMHVIQFNHYLEYPDGNGYYIDAQMILYPTGQIKIQYDYIHPSMDDDGMTIGIQSSDANLGLQVAYNTTYVHDGLALLFDLPAHFIIDVDPAHGFIASGQEHEIIMTYSAENYPVGTYTEDLEIWTNALPPNDLVFVPNIMHVYTPAQFAGMVTDAGTGAPLNGTIVTATYLPEPDINFSTSTDPNGNYSLIVDPGDYMVEFDKVGYQNFIDPDTNAAAGVVTPLDVMLWEELYAPGSVLATVNDDDTECLVEWTDPFGAYEVIYDDGSADNYLVYSVFGNGHAVKFTPAGYPATVIGGRVYVGDGSFPVNADFLGSTFGMAVLDDDGTDGMPGTVLDSIEVVVDQFGWISFEGLFANITDGDFYLVMYQGEVPPNAAPIGIDQSMPTVYRSYSYIRASDTWSISAYQDFMMRAIVFGPQTGFDLVMTEQYVQPPKPIYEHRIAYTTPNGVAGYVKSGEIKQAPEYNLNNSRAHTGFRVARFDNFDPYSSPLTGDTNVVQNNTSNHSYVDLAWGGLLEGWYAYGVAARYNQGGNVWSDYTPSNIVGHLKDVSITVNVTTTDGSIADSVELVFTGLIYPESVYTHFTDETATVTWDPVWKGYYNLYAYKLGYYPVEMNNLWINEDQTIEVVLQEKRYAPYNLYVDPLTSIATWNAPNVVLVNEGFENADFPPEGWTSFTQGEGWFRTDDGSSAFWTVPSWEGYYAVSNDDGAGSTNNGSEDYLVTPALDLREANGFVLTFDSYYDGMYSQLAYVEYSLDGGATWEVLEQLTAQTNWTQIEIDLSEFSGSNGESALWIAFHADDNGTWASGWAIDNVKIAAGSPSSGPPMGYHVFLDDAFVAEVDVETYTYLNLMYGTEYTASVGALYSSGLSEKDYYTFTSEWLYPPENLAAANYDNAVNLIWEPPCAPWFEVLTSGPRKEMPNPNSEYSPIYRDVVNNNPAQRDLWDTQFEFPCGDASGEAGVESDGSYIYTTKWNAGNGTFFRYQLDGTFLGSFVISGGPADVRDLAYDGENFYGSNAGFTVWGMDFNDEVLVETISAPVAVRAIAYDEGFDGFWANNWSDAITLFDRDGVTLNSFMPGSYISYYGFAYDDQFTGGPYLYGFSQSGSGAVIVELEIASGAETGVTYDAIGFSTTGTGIAGGLAIANGLDPDNRTLLGIIQNETIFGLEFGEGGPPGPPTTCEVPDNVIGFNVYRDGEFVEYVEYFGEETLSWWDYNLWPECYDYTVTAVYDLSPYGYFGQEGESMIEGPATICVHYGYELPFFEDWEAGTFEAKEWEVQCDNWDINTLLGNPGNCAEFQWDPVQEEYDCGIVTYPLLGYWIEDGKIMLDFDLKIDDRFDTVDTEKLTVRVWAEGEWTDKKEFVAMGDMGWTSYSIDISTPAKGHDFRVGFFANGMSSLNIDGWYVDNVHIYQLCEEPKDLTLEKIYETQQMGVNQLNWTPPGAMVGYWISYNDGTFENAIASTEGGAGLAQLFTPEEYPMTITEVRYFNDSYEQYMQECEIWILTGDGGTVLGGPYYVEDGPADDWVTVDVDDLTIESGTFMVATFNVMAGGPYIGIDDSFYDGSLYFGAIGDFTEMGEFGYFYVGSHEVYVEVEIGDNVVVNSVLTAPKASANNQLSAISLAGSSATAPRPASRELRGYNIWRNDELIVENWPDVIYNDTLYESNYYCYYISALYDQCESDTLGYVCDEFFVGLNEAASGMIDIYPNPTKDVVNIESPQSIKRITVMNNVGQLVYDATELKENFLKLDVSAYESGIYFIKIETAEGITTERVTVSK